MKMTPTTDITSVKSSSTIKNRLPSGYNQPQRDPIMLRRYDVIHQTSSGEMADFARVAPALPAFEEAFSAFARGTVFDTENGPVAVEDLLPGDMIRTVDNGYQPLLWRGSIMLVPSLPDQARKRGQLTRISAGTFGPNRPARDLVLGPAARLYHRSPAAKALSGQSGAFIPVQDFTDGVSIVDLTPMTAVQVFHLAFDEQERLLSDGIEVESYHPGPIHRFALRGEMLGIYMTLFPHLARVADITTPRYPRLRLQDLDLFNVA